MNTSVLTALLLAVPAAALAQATAPPTYRVDVIETTPLPGVDLPLEAIPAPARTTLDTDILDSGAIDLSDFLNRRLANVFINEIQGNPFQPDVNFRGYTASPLLGTPQGLSVYMDGVRLNQPFGDVVSWDLIPRVAIASATLMPGSNPVFGLNTLGGALVVQTKDGRGSPGTSVQAIGGDYGRRAVEFEHGRSFTNGANWYLAGNLFHDSGWRDSSPSDVRQIFTKAGWQDAKTELRVTGAYADNALTGNGLQEQRLLAADYASVYTTPDTTDNRAAFVNVTARRSVTPQANISANAYFRDIRTATVNGDLDPDSLGGLLTGTSTTQDNYGVSGQINVRRNSASMRNQFTAGGGFDRSTVAFGQTAQPGDVNADRRITPSAGLPTEDVVDLSGIVRTASAFATNTTSIAGMWHVTLSGRFNQTTIRNRDRLSPTAGPGSLTGDYSFSRFNPSAGLTVNPARKVNAYVSYSEGSRAPTSIELGCADPATPCRLPNALAGDPPLEQVVTHTWEAGARGDGRGRFDWNAGLFRGTNTHDLLFVAAAQTGFGYFRNFGETRRQGVELGGTFQGGRAVAGAAYSLTDATYLSDESVSAAANSSNRGGVIAIRAGDRIPLVPRHSLKAYLDLRATPKLSIDVNSVSASGSPARGNDNGAHQPDGISYLGAGGTAAYTVVNAGARYALTPTVQAIVQINNVFNARYYSAAQLGPAAFTGTGVLMAARVGSTFYAPGAPVTFWAGVRVSWRS